MPLCATPACFLSRCPPLAPSLPPPYYHPLQLLASTSLRTLNVDVLPSAGSAPLPPHRSTAGGTGEHSVRWGPDGQQQGLEEEEEGQEGAARSTGQGMVVGRGAVLLAKPRGRSALGARHSWAPGGPGPAAPRSAPG